MKEIKEMSYNEAVAELEQILRTMRRATELIAECRARLTATDEELRTILAGMQE